MKPLNVFEVQEICKDLQSYLGAKFQGIKTSEKIIAFQLFHKSRVEWIEFNLNSITPMIMTQSEEPNFKLKKTPLYLFAKAHLVGKILREVLFDKANGRVLYFSLGSKESSVSIEFRMFPHGQNLIISTADKKISWDKIKELKSETDSFVPGNIRSWQEIKNEFNSQFSKDTQAFDFKKEISKREDLIQKVKTSMGENIFKKVGQWIKDNQSLDVPREFETYVNRTQKMSKNIENLFAKSKQFESKLLGHQNRLDQLNAEILSLKEGKIPVGTKTFLKPKGEMKRTLGIKVHLGDQLIGVVGKSAKENIELLRKSSPWDIWIHLKDYPGAHGFIRRNKNQVIQLEDIKKVAFKLAERSHVASGEVFDVISTECRYVKPIKGDKLGRVNYMNVTNYTLKF